MVAGAFSAVIGCVAVRALVSNSFQLHGWTGGPSVLFMVRSYPLSLVGASLSGFQRLVEF